jgi:Fic family protein
MKKFTPIAAIEPMLPSEMGIERSDLPDLVIDLERKAAKLGGMVNPTVLRVITEHMRVINSYYSNLIEGNSTHPREIRKAMEGDYNDDPAKRDLQLESIAHIKAQEALEADPPSLENLNTPECIAKIHRLFYENIPESLRIVEGPNNEPKFAVPGQFRGPGEEVKVGRHLPPEAEVLEIFFNRFSKAYSLKTLHGQKKIITAMAAHHRFLWIHPFLDGNGRVARLYTDLFLREIGIGGYGVWNISRGLAKNNAEYKSNLAKADYTRQGDLDGRGALSEKNLIEFCEFMLRVAIDQVEYMEELLDLKPMVKRIKSYVDDRNKGLIIGLKSLKPEAVKLLEKAFMYGEFERSEMEEISGLGLSVTRKLVQQLKEEGLLTETSTKSPLRWAIPDHAEQYYFPKLTPIY